MGEHNAPPETGSSKMLISCSRCNGTGIYEGNSCVPCGGTGRIEAMGHRIVEAYAESIYVKQPTATKLIYAYQIVEVINATEYTALVDAAKDRLRIHLSCGVLDLDHLGQIYANLMAIFASSPITKAAIESL